MLTVDGLLTIPGTSEPKNEKDACISTAQNPRKRADDPLLS